MFSFPAKAFEIRSSLGDINILFDDFQKAQLVGSFDNLQEEAGSLKDYPVSNLQIGKLILQSNQT